MGIFSSKYVTQVGTAISRVIEDVALPNAVTSGSLRSLFNDGNVSDYVLEELVASIGVRAERMYSYAENHYVHGLPSGEIYSSTQGRAQVEAVIEAAENQQVLIKYSNYGPPNTLHIGWMKLVSLHGYNPNTNQLMVLSVQKGFPVYLKDMVVVVPTSQKNTFEAGALDQWGTAASAGYTPERINNIGLLTDRTTHSPIFESSSATELHLKVTYVWRAVNGSISEETLTISVADYDNTADYFHAKYVVGGQTKYWMYKNKTGVYPTLDAVFVDGPAVSGSYFPFAYFRYNKQSVIQNKTTAAYLTSKKLLKYLGIDFDLLAESIDENPDIADVEQAMLVMAVPAVSQNPIECRYLFDYFDSLYYSMGGSASALVEAAQAALYGDATKQRSIIIKDQQFKMALQNSGIYKRIVAGSIGAIGTHTSSVVIEQEEQEFTDIELGTVSSSLVPVKFHSYKKQIATGLYEEVLVRELQMKYWIFQEYTTTSDENDSILLIPIDRTISGQYSMGDREVLYSRSLHFVFNSRVVTKVKWYQTGVFQLLLIIVAIAITIYTYGADGGSAIATALGLSGTAGLVATILFNLAVGKLLEVGFKLFVKAFGSEVAIALAVIAILYGGYKVIQAGSVSGAPWAMELLQISNGLIQAGMKDKFSDLLGEAESFKAFADEETKLLEKANQLLESSTVLSPFVIFGEQPQDFYNRTVHSGNVGILGINAISSYVDIALTLPKLKDTLGEDAYV